MLSQVYGMTLSWNNIPSMPLVVVLDQGSVPAFVNLLSQSTAIEGIVEIVFEKVVLEGLRTPVRNERLKEMITLLVSDPRFKSTMIDGFFTSFEFEQNYSSFKAVSFWNYLKEICPELLKDHSFFTFLLRSSDCDKAEVQTVNDCVRDLLAKVDLDLVDDLHLCVHHRFFSIVYPLWVNPPNDQMIKECAQQESLSYAPRVSQILKNTQGGLSNHFDFALTNHSFSVAYVLLVTQPLLVRKVTREFFIKPIDSDDELSDQKKALRKMLMKKLKELKLPSVVKERYLTALKKCINQDIPQDSTSSSEERVSKKPRKDKAC